MTRVRRTLAVLLVAAVAATGGLSRALVAPPGAGTGATVAVAGLGLAVAGGLTLRILVVLGRHGTPQSTSHGHLPLAVGVGAHEEPLADDEDGDAGRQDVEDEYVR